MAVDELHYNQISLRAEVSQEVARDLMIVTLYTEELIKLEQNYRCGKRILRAANKLIANNPHLHEKKLWSEHPEGAQIRVIGSKAASSGGTSGQTSCHSKSRANPPKCWSAAWGICIPMQCSRH